PLGARARIPRQAKRLEAPPRERNEVLLEWIDPERVGDLELGELAVGTVGADEVLPVAAEERRRDALLGDARLVEAAEDGLGRGGVPRAGVVRGPVGRHLLGVTARAFRGAHEGRSGGGGRLGGRRGLIGALTAGHEGQARQRRREKRAAGSSPARGNGGIVGRRGYPWCASP